MAEELVQDHVATLLSDTALARDLRSPLGSTLKFHGELLRDKEHKATEAEIAFRIQLPVLSDIHPELLLKIRRDEADHFVAFQDSLRTAIRDRLSRQGDEKPDLVAQEIRSDVIDPALNEIKRRLDAARETLVKKAGVSIGVGALATTCGLLTANPLMITAGVGPAIRSSVGAVHKYIEERRDISMSDMYFLWKAQQHADSQWN